MTITDRPQYVTFPGSAVVVGVGMNVPFDVQARSEVAVLYGDDFEALLDVDYTVTLAPDYRSAVVFPLAGLVDKMNGGTVTIRSDLPFTQGWQVPINARLAENDVQRTTDRDVLRDRQLFEEMDHGFKAYFNNPTMVSVEGRRVSNVGTPIADADAARRQDVQILSDRMDDILASGGTSIIRDTATVVSAAAVPEAQSPDYYRVAGRSTVADGGAGLWKFEPDIPGVPAALKFANGSRIFINRSSKVRPEEAGAKGTGSPADAAANVAAFSAVLNSTEHSWISLDQPAVYKLSGPLVRTLQTGVVIEMHPEAELDFTATAVAAGPSLKLAGALGAATSLTADAETGDTVIAVTSTVGFVVGQGAKIASNLIFDPVENVTPIAEIGVVVSVGIDTITLLEGLDAIYRVSEGATLKPVTYAEGIRIIGGFWRGNKALSHEGIQLQFARDAVCEGLQMIDWTQRAGSHRDCLGGRVEAIDVQGSGVPAQTDYGWTAWGSTRGMTLTGSTFRRLGPSFTTNNTPADGGIPREITVSENYVYNATVAGLHVHTACKGVRFLRNWVLDAENDGIKTDGPDIEVVGNRLVRCGKSGSPAISWVNESHYDGRAVIADNIIEDPGARGIFATGASHGDSSSIDRLRISRNEIYRAGAEGIHVKDAETGGRSQRIEIAENYIETYDIAAISLQDVDHFEVHDNVSLNALSPSASAVKLVNCTDGRVRGEHHLLPDGDDSGKRGLEMLSACVGIRVGGLSRFRSNGTTGKGISAENDCTGNIVERSVLVSGFPTLIDLGTATDSHDKRLLEPIALTIADDQVGSFGISPITHNAMVQINARTGVGFSPHGIFWARSGGSPYAEQVGSTMIDVTFTTGSLTPGFGTDGKVTISVNTSDTVYISNRLGSTITFDLQMLTG